MTWNLSCSGILMVSTMARWIESERARRNSGFVPLRRAMRTNGIPMRCRGRAGVASSLRAQVEGLPAGEGEEAVLGERHPLARVLHARPRQQRVEVIAAVYKGRAGLDLRP